MTLDQLAERVIDLERQVAELRRDFTPGTVQATFGMFANDPDFDEIVRLGRKYREQANTEDT